MKSIMDEIMLLDVHLEDEVVAYRQCIAVLVPVGSLIQQMLMVAISCEPLGFLSFLRHTNHLLKVLARFLSAIFIITKKAPGVWAFFFSKYILLKV